MDRRPGAKKVLAHVFETQLSDENKTVKIRVNPEFSYEKAEELAKYYGNHIGLMPKTLRKDLHRVDINDGDGRAGGAPGVGMLIHDKFDDYLNEN